MVVMLSPYEQGYLDGLCGIYSVINAVRLLTKIDEDEAMELFKDIMRHIEKTKRLSHICTGGISPSDMYNILRDVIAKKYPIEWQRPYFRVRRPSVDVFWDRISAFIKEDSRRAVIVWMEYKDWDHWSVVKTLTANRMTFFDSAGFKVIARGRSETAKGRSKYYFLKPSNTFFLYCKA
jgi:hypothetical protein